MSFNQLSNNNNTNSANTSTINNNSNHPINHNTNNPSLSPDQAQAIYKRIQQLKQQYGENVSKVPEFVELYQLLNNFMRFQTQLRQQQQYNNNNNNNNTSNINNANNTISINSNANTNVNVNSNANANTNSTTPTNNQQFSIFSQQQSQLLKCQIAAFKALVKQQPVSNEISSFINSQLKFYFNNSGNNSNNKLQQQQAPQQHQQPHPVPQQNQYRQQLHPQQQIPPQQIPPQQIPPQQIPPQQIPQQPIPQQIPQHVPQQIQTPIQPPQPPQPPQPVFLKSLPPHPPISLNKLKSKFPNVDNIININDPNLVVNSYSSPQYPIQDDEISFEFLNDPKSRIMTPGLFPTSLDLKQAYAIYQMIENLQKDQFFNGDTKQNDDELDLFPLLSYQKSLRGYILSFVYHQNSLLTNIHPNFLTKSRKISLNDSNITNHLYLQQKKLLIQSQKSKSVKRQTNILNASNHFMNNLSKRKEKFNKLGSKVLLYHQQTEKEEQKRIERNAKQRLQALKANDEEAYIKLLDQTKDTRITHLLKQTNTFLNSLTQAVRSQQKETEKNLLQNGHIKRRRVITDEFGNQTEVDVSDDEEAAAAAAAAGDDDSEDAEEAAANADYYSVAHRIQEKITKQPSILVGGTLKEYQLRGLEWMVSLFNNHLNGILADEMGLGKTIQTISLITYLVEVKKIKGPFLVIVPLSTLPNWNIEFDKWAPSVKKISYKGTPQYRKDLGVQVKNGDFQILLTTYEYIIKDKYLLSKIKWVHMIIDEGHRMKNTKSKLSYTLSEFYHTDYRLILTGTPLQNNLPELWALLNFVLPKIFNSVKSFDEWFNTPFANTGNQDKIELSEEETLLVIRRLHKVLRPFLLRRLKKDVEKNLPNKVEKVIKCRKSALQSKLYSHMLKYNQLFIGDSETNDANSKAVSLKGLNNKLMQLRKICNHPFVFGAIEDMINPDHLTNEDIWRTAGKFELLDRILPKFQKTGHRVLMFFQMTQIMDIMEDFLRYKNMKYMRLDGDTKADDRTVLLKEFNAEDSPYFVFLLSTRAGGLGLNLQTADTVIIFDTDWNPHQDLQAQDRAHRIGQKNEVRILRLITNDSIEEMILERAHQKLDIDGKVIQAGKFDQKSTSEEQEALLRQLLENEENQEDDELDDELDDKELNEILARNDDELKLFQQLDEERINEAIASGNNKPRLFSEAELPEIYKKEPEIVDSTVEVISELYGRGARERKQTQYDENISEEQWLRQIDGYASESDDDDDDESSSSKRKRGKKRSRGRKMKTASSLGEDQSDGTATPNGNGSANYENDDEFDEDGGNEDGMDIDDDGDDSNELDDEGNPKKRPKFSSKSKKSTGKSAKSKIKARPGKSSSPMVGESANGTATSSPAPGTANITASTSAPASASAASLSVLPTEFNNEEIEKYAIANQELIMKSKVKSRGVQVAPPICRDTSIHHPSLSNRNRAILQTQCHMIFERLIKFTTPEGRKLSSIFMLKPLRRIYPDYYVIIKYPLAFDGIRRRIQSQTYMSLEEFITDLHQLFANARIYNQEGSVIFHDSKMLEDEAVRLYHILTENKEISFKEFDEKFGLVKPVLAGGVVPLAPVTSTVNPDSVVKSETMAAASTGTSGI